MSLKEISLKKNTRFLVTGGAGFIGSNLCDYLVNKECYVVCLDNFSNGKLENIQHLMKSQYFRLIEGDIRDFDTCMEACSGVDYVLHQAAWGSVPRSIEMPQLYNEINVRGTLNMLEASKKCGVKKFVYASSSSVYGDELNLPKQEDKIGRVLSPYALTKKINEEYARLYFVLYGLQTVGLRYFNVFGRRQDPNGAYAAVIPKFIKCLLNGDDVVIYGDGTYSRDFTYIDNVIEANLKACFSGSKANGEVFNVAYGGRVSIYDLYRTIAKVLKTNKKPIFANNRIGDIPHSNADISKSKKIIGYNPEFSFEKGIKLTIDWYLSDNYEK